MRRDINQALVQWQHSERRKPLILDGARQVGKTHALRHFGDEAYENCVYLNFERDQALAAYFRDSIDPKRLIEVLGLHARAPIYPGRTLLIFDEVQECPEALNSLKYFCEEASDYHIAAAGSLLGIKTINTKGFPVGKVNFLHLYPLNFGEFLDALGETQLRSFLTDYPDRQPLPKPLHQRALDLLKKYFYSGGMPEVVAHFSQHTDYAAAREIQFEILEAYERDFAKHAPENQVMKIITVWKQLHTQLAKENKKFIFSQVRQGARGRDYEEAIEWLIGAGLIYKCFHISTPKLPIAGNFDQHIFKIYPLDVGLLGAMSGLMADTIIKENTLFTEYKGALTEGYVAQTLKACKQPALCYWTSNGKAEVDFIVAHKQTLYPLEVKAGTSNKKKSLMVYADKFKPEWLLRSTQMNLKQDDRLLNIPLYMLFDLHRLLDRFY